MMADNAARHLSESYTALAQSTERLSSGLRINSAKDDPAGMAVSELIKADVAQLQQGSRNAQDGVSMLQTAEGAMNVIDQNLTRMKELAEQASTGSYSSAQRGIMNSEYGQLADEIDRIASSTSFNGIEMLNTSATYKINVGSSQTIDVNGSVMSSTVLGVKTGAGQQETYDNKYGVAAGSDLYLTSANFDSTGANDKFKFRIVSSAAGSASAQVTVDLSASKTTGISLNDLVNKINTAWTTAGKTGTVAYAAFDSGTQQYRLQLQNTAVGASHLKTSSLGTFTGLDAAANFTNPVNGSSGTAVTLATTSGATTALTALTSAIKYKDAYRAKLGYMMNRLDSAASVVDIQTENLQTADSRISDTDVATEMATMTRNQVLAQAGISMLTQANTMPQMALQLLKG
jgi:flagellin